jgi:hypothetical protein
MQETLKNMAKILENLPNMEQIKGICEQGLSVISEVKTMELSAEDMAKLDESQASILSSVSMFDKLKGNLNGHNN